MGGADGGCEPLLLEPRGDGPWGKEALAKVGSSSCPAAEPVRARSTPHWVAGGAVWGKSLPGHKDFVSCLWWIVGRLCRAVCCLSVPPLLSLVLTSCISPAFGKGLSAALTFLSLSLSPLLWQEVLMKQIHKVRGAGSHIWLVLLAPTVPLSCAQLKT